MKTIPSENNNGRILYATSTFLPQAHAAEPVDTESNITSSNKTASQQNAKEPRIRDHSVDSGSTLANFAKRHSDVEFSSDFSSDENNSIGKQ